MILPRFDSSPQLGISAISIFQPDWTLTNDWFENLPRKFVKHTGIEKRSVARVDEVALAVRATENLISDSGCEIGDCAGVVFTSPSFVPVALSREVFGEEQARRYQLNRAAARFADLMNMQPRRIAATNTFCAGYAKAMSIAMNRVAPSIDLQTNEFILLVTTSRISHITDYRCPETSGLFGDMATATMISRTDSTRYPARFELVAANTDRLPTNRPFFDFISRNDVPVPVADGGTKIQPKRIVFTLDGMGVADSASRAMASSAMEMVEQIRLQPEDIDFIIPHQAGSAIVRLAEMKMRDMGFTGEVINGMANQIGNVSSGSIPYAIYRKWSELHGNILCPVASVGRPGKPFVTEGCIALRSADCSAETRVDQADSVSVV